MGIQLDHLVFMPVIERSFGVVKLFEVGFHI